MSTTLIIATRELRERSRLFIVAVAIAILPFAIALVPSARGNRTHTIMIIGAAAAFGYACAVALAMGVSTIGHDLSEKRFSFYFSKPISPVALWIGKAGASLLVALVCSLIIAIPSYLAARDVWRAAWVTGGDRFALAAPLMVTVLFLISHALGTMTRSRSVLVALDFVLAVATVGAVAAIVRPILFSGGGHVALAYAWALGIGLFVILAVAPVWQLARGRTDIRRSHAAFSTFFWSAVATLLAFAAGVFLWLHSSTPADLVEVENIAQASSGGWAVVTGVSAHRGDFRSTFLLNARTGEFARLTVPWSGVQWSRDGRVAAWIQPNGFRYQGTGELYTRTVGSDHTVASGIETNVGRQFVLSADGSRVAIVKDGVVAVHDLANHRLLASARGAQSYQSKLLFLTNDLLRIVEYETVRHRNDATLRIADLDVRARKLTTYAEREIASEPFPFSLSEDGSRMFIRTTREIVDGRTLVPIATLESPANYGSWMLNDGSVVTVDTTKGVVLHLFDRDGRRQADLALLNQTAARVAGETTDGKLLVNASIMPPRGRSVVVVNRATFTTDRIVSDARVRWPYWNDPQLPRYQAGTTFLSEGEDRRLKSWR